MHRTRNQVRPIRSGLFNASVRVRRHLLSLRAHLGAARLDQELAAGARPQLDPLLCERTRYLLSRDSREKIALGLDRALDQAQRPALYRPQAPVRSRAVREVASTLMVVIRRLRGSRPVSPQGVAKAKILLSDDSGPLYNAESESDLTTAAQATLGCLDVGYVRSPAAREMVVDRGR